MPASYTSARFVGREVAFARLAAVLDDAASGRSRTLILGGTAGVGISRFLDEGVARVAELSEPWTILRGGAWPCGADDPYAPVVRAIGPALRALDDAALETVLGPAALDVIRLLPDLSVRLGDPVEGIASAPERRQARTLEAILGMLGRLGDRQPVALILEDLHRADAATRALVRLLSRIARDQRLAIIASDQPDIVPRDDPWSSDLAAIAAAPRSLERLTLEPLDRDDLAALIEGIQGERASASLLLLVVERSGGLPLVAEELLASRRELPSSSLSDTLDALVIARVQARSPECRRVLRLMAPAGLPLTAQQLADVSEAYETETDSPAPRSASRPRHGDGVLDADVRAGLAEAIEHGFVVERDGAIAFRHEAIGRAVERDLLPIARTRHRVALATALAGPPALLAKLWAGAHDPVLARAASIEAAAIAATKYAPADELAALEAALAIPDRPIGTAASRRKTGRSSVNADLQIRAAEAAFAVGRGSRASAYLEAAIGALDVRRERVRLGLLYHRLAHIRRAAGDPDGAMQAARRAVELVPRETSPERATVLAGLAQLKMLDGAFTDGRRLAKEAIRVARACDPIAHEQDIHATTTLGVAMAWGSDPEGAIDLLWQAERGRAGPGRSRGAVPHHRQPHDRARPGRPADRGRRGRLSRHRGRAPGRPGGRVRQLPARQRLRIAVPARSLDGGSRTGVAGPRLAPDRGHLPDRGRAARDDRDRDRSGRAGRAATSGGRRSSSMPCRNRSWPAPTTWRPPRSPCGAAMSRTLPARSSGAGPPSARRRSGSSPPGWPPWSRGSTPPSAPRPMSSDGWRHWPPHAVARPRSSGRPQDWSGPAAHRRRPVRGGSPRRTSPRPARSNGASRVTTTRPSGIAWRRPGPTCRRPTTWRWRAGARRRRS